MKEQTVIGPSEGM